MNKDCIYQVNTPFWDESLSKIIGERETRFLIMILYWLNKSGKKNVYENTYWTYNTYKQWDALWGGPGIRTIKRVVARLRALGLIETAQHKLHKGYAVNFYRVNLNKLENILKEGKCRFLGWFSKFKDNLFNCLNMKVTKYHDKQRLTSSNVYISIYNGSKIVDKCTEPPPTGTPPEVLLEKRVEISKQTSKRIGFLVGNLKKNGSIPHYILEKGVSVIAQEIEFHVSSFKKFKMRSIDHAINSACKLVRTGKWRTPYGFTFGLEELSERHKREDKKLLKDVFAGNNDKSSRLKDILSSLVVKY